MPSSSDTYLHGHHDSVLRSHRWRTAENSAGYLLPRLAPDARVLDVGCGPGTITADLAARVPGGDVTGIDAAADVLAQARQEAERRGLRNVRFDTGDVYRLGFADGTFDVVHAHQVLQHLTDPVAALREMRRVCRPGGLVAARDGDYGGFFWFPGEPEMDRVAGAVPGRGPGDRRGAGRGTAHAGLGPPGRVYGGRGLGQRLVLLRTAGPDLVGHVVGAAADRIAVRRPGGRARAGHARGPGAAGPGLAALGGQRGRLVPHPARRDPAQV